MLLDSRQNVTCLMHVFFSTLEKRRTIGIEDKNHLRRKTPRQNSFIHPSSKLGGGGGGLSLFPVTLLKTAGGRPIYKQQREPKEQSVRERERWEKSKEMANHGGGEGGEQEKAGRKWCGLSSLSLRKLDIDTFEVSSVVTLSTFPSFDTQRARWQQNL